MAVVAEIAPGAQPPRRIRLLVLVGLVGSGKSTLAEAMVKTGQWVRASQDDAPSKRRQECEDLVRKALRDGKDVIVDRVNFDPQQRVHFLKIAREFSNVDCICLILDVPRPVLEDRLTRRTDHPTITDAAHALKVLGMMLSSYKPPVPDIPEGFKRVFALPYTRQPENASWTEESIIEILKDLADDPQGWSDEGKEVIWNESLPPPSNGYRGSFRGRERDHQPDYRPNYRPSYRPDYRSDYRSNFRPDYQPSYRPSYRPSFSAQPPANGSQYPYLDRRSQSRPPTSHAPQTAYRPDQAGV